MKQTITCDNCGSRFQLIYDEIEVSYSAAHCNFCGDFFDNKNEELDFNTEETIFEDSVDEEDDDDMKGIW